MSNQTYSVKTVETAGGVSYPSFLGSWIFWRKALSKTMLWDTITDVVKKPYHKLTRTDVIRFFSTFKEAENNQCPQCGGQERFHDTKSGNNIWCLCSIVDWQRKKIAAIDEFRSPMQPATFSSFATASNSRDVSESLTGALNVSKEFARFLNTWLILSGPYQTGKTHLARAIATNIGPLCLYVTASDFSQKMFQATAENRLAEMILTFQNAPILIIDDMGAEHKAGYILTNFLSVISARHADPFEHPTVITTNVTEIDFRMTWERLGARLTDNRFNFYEISGAVPQFQHKVG